MVEQKRKIILDCKTAENMCVDQISSIGQSKTQKESELEVLTKEILHNQAQIRQLQDEQDNVSKETIQTVTTDMKSKKQLVSQVQKIESQRQILVKEREGLQQQKSSIESAYEQQKLECEQYNILEKHGDLEQFIKDQSKGLQSMIDVRKTNADELK